MEAWVNLAGIPNGVAVAYLLKKGAPTSDLRTYSLQLTSSGRIRGTVYIGLGDTRYVEVSSIKLGEWRHYAAVYAADGRAVQVDPRLNTGWVDRAWFGRLKLK